MEVGTEVHHPLDHYFGINLLRSTEECPPELRQGGILNKGTRNDSRVTDRLTQGMMMEVKKMNG